MFKKVLVLVSLLFFSQYIVAQEEVDYTQFSLEQLLDLEVTTAGKTLQKVIDVPTSIVVISAEEISAYGYRTLAQVLQNTPGFYTSYDRNYTYAGVRGFARPGDYNNRILLLLNGHPLNEWVFSSSYINYEFPVSINLIDHIEVVYGPGSSLYGSNALFAVVNVVTKSGEDVNLQAQTGNYNYSGGDFIFSKKGLTLNGRGFNSAGQDLYFSEFDSTSTYDGQAVDRDGEKGYSAFGEFRKGKLTVSSAFYSREKEVPTASFETIFNEGLEKTTDNRAFGELTYKFEPNLKTEIKIRSYLDYYYYHGDYPWWDDTTSAQVLLKDSGEDLWFGSELQLNYRLNKDNQLIVGSEYTRIAQAEQEAHDVDPYSQYLSDKQEENIFSLYLQDNINLLQELALSLGLRYDSYSLFDSVANPRISLVYKPFAKSALKILYGSAYRAPSFYEAFYQDGGISAKANPELKSEKIETYEVNWLEQIGPRFLLSVSVYKDNIKNLISQETDPADGLLQYQNIGKVDGLGCTGSIWAELGKAKAKFSYTLQQTEDKDSGELLENSPQNYGNAGIAFPLYKEKIKTGVSLVYLGKRKTFAGGEVDPYALINLNFICKKLIENLDISLGIYNLLDQEYSDPVGGEFTQEAIPQDGRNFLLTLNYKF